MLQHIRANLWLLALTLLLCSVVYPLALMALGQTLFPHQAQGGLIDGAGNPVLTAESAVGSRLIAQPFAGEGYFQPRPSAASYNASASGASNWGPSNYLLRDRVARQLGPVVKYRGGRKKGQPVAPDIEAWFRNDRYQGRPGIVAQWAQAHPAVASAWVKADKLNSEHVAAWQREHPEEVTRWVKDNPSTPEPKPEDLAVPFFAACSRANPGTFPGAVERKGPDGNPVKRIEPVREGADIQGAFFDMWLQEHPQADLEPVPADMVMASGSGLDPHITLKNAMYQLDRVAGKWAKETRRDAAEVRKEVEDLLRARKEAALSGLAGVGRVNVLEVNLALRERYGRSTETRR
ncbi:MAG: potassium-transporting ATPase subunit C [Gemmataceae bacterium]